MWLIILKSYLVSRTFGLSETCGPRFEGRVLGLKRKYDKVVQRELKKYQEALGQYELPDHLKLYNLDTENINWYYDIDDNIKVFIADHDIQYLSRPLFADGTFGIVKNLKFCQIYILTTYITDERNIFFRLKLKNIDRKLQINFKLKKIKIYI